MLGNSGVAAKRGKVHFTESNPGSYIERNMLPPHRFENDKICDLQVPPTFTPKHEPATSRISINY